MCGIEIYKQERQIKGEIDATEVLERNKFPRGGGDLSGFTSDSLL